MRPCPNGNAAGRALIGARGLGEASRPGRQEGPPQDAAGSVVSGME